MTNGLQTGWAATYSLPLHVLKYRTRWSKVEDDGTNAKDPNTASFSRAKSIGFESRDMVVAAQKSVWTVSRFNQGSSSSRSESDSCANDYITYVQLDL